MLFSNTSEIKNNRSLLNPIQSYFRSYFSEIRDRSYFVNRSLLFFEKNRSLLFFEKNRSLLFFEKNRSFILIQSLLNKLSFILCIYSNKCDLWELNLGSLSYTHLTSQHFSYWVTFYEIENLFNMCWFINNLCEY